jgi:CheY-like chemotaxis protein
MSSNEKKLILFVDDEAEILEMYRELFEADGFGVLTAGSAIEALEIYKKNQNIKLIISDSKMKEMSGLDFLKTLKVLYKTIPVFYLATGDPDISEDFIKSVGGNGLLLKPFDLDEILVTINKCFKI